MYLVQIRKIFSCKLWGCLALRNEDFPCVLKGKIGLVLSILPPCSTPADAHEVANDAALCTGQGNVADEAVDVSHHTKNTVTTRMIWLCS